MGSSYFLWRIVGCGRAAEMCMTGDRVQADEAYRIGLVYHVHTREEPLPAARAMAASMCSKNKLGLRLTKDALNASSLQDTGRMEGRNQAFFIVSGMFEGMKRAGE